MAAPATQPSMQTEERPVTFAEYRALPDDGPRYELIRGELIEMPAPKATHQRVAFRLAIALQEHVEARGLGEVFIAPFDVRLSGYSGVQPDILFIRAENIARVGEDYVDGPPDLIVEVLSPSNRRVDLVRKRMLYADYGVPEYWTVDPNLGAITINVLDGDHYIERAVRAGAVTSTVLPDLELDFAKLFKTQ